MIRELNVVLVRPTFSGNIGSVVRALANMGGHRLILIDPKCEIDDSTVQMACGAKAWLEHVYSHTSWKQFFSHEPEGYRIALTRRDGKKRPVDSLNATLEDLKINAPDFADEKIAHPLYLVFGPEASGLSAEDMGWCHRAASLPAPGEFKSLNLSHAVLLGLYVARQALGVKLEATSQSLAEQNSPYPKSDVTPHTAPRYFPDQAIRRWLEAMGFSLSKRRKSAYLVLRRLLLQNWPTENELQVLEAILQQNIRKLERARKEKRASATLLE